MLPSEVPQDKIENLVKPEQRIGIFTVDYCIDLNHLKTLIKEYNGDMNHLKDINEKHIIIECYGPLHFNGLNKLDKRTLQREERLSRFYVPENLNSFKENRNIVIGLDLKDHALI